VETIMAPERRPHEGEIDVYGLTHRGLVRPRNEDHYLVASVSRSLRVLSTSLPAAPDIILPELPADERTAFLAIVADGVGGSANGEEASRLAVETVTHAIATRLHSLSQVRDRDDAVMQELAAAARHAHDELLRRGGEDSTRRGMATTLTLWIGLWPHAYVLQVGDSRCYHYGNGELTQVSRDQTIAEELVQQGVLSRVQAMSTRWANVLSSAIGGPNTEPTVTRDTNDWSSVHLLCSDGLTKHVSDDRIRERLATMTSAKQACEALLQDALDGGGTDNITIVIGRAVIPGTAAASV
jgi:serine/threonine protein phosphatase PrpC